MVKIKKKNNIAKNYIYNLIYQLIVIIVPLVTTPYLSRVLGAEQIGIYSYTLSITTYFILFGSLGVAMYAQREIAYVQENSYKRSKTFFEIIIMRTITLGSSLLLFYLFFCLKGSYITYYKILVFEILANALDISWFFQGLEEFKKVIMRNIVVKVISIICIFLFVKEQKDLNIYFYIYVFSTFFGNLSTWFYLPKYIEKVNIKKLEVKKHFKPVVGLFIPQIAIQIYTVLDKTMIGAIVSDKAEVGYYEQSQKIVKFLLTIATSLGTVMVPRMANTYAKGNKEKLKYYMNNSFAFVTFLAFPLMFGIISISKKFVPIFYGAGFEKAIYIISLISPIILAIAFSNVIGTQYLIPTKQQKKFTISVVCGAITNFVFNLILISYLKSIGAAIATVIAEFTVTGVQFYLIRKEINIVNVIKISYKYFIASIVMFVISLFVGSLIKNNFISIIVQFLVSVIVYLSILYVMKDNLILEGINIIKKFIKKEVKENEETR